MLRDSRLRKMEQRHQLRYRPFTRSEHVDDPNPGIVRQRRKRLHTVSISKPEYKSTLISGSGPADGATSAGARRTTLRHEVIARERVRERRATTTARGDYMFGSLIPY